MRICAYRNLPYTVVLWGLTLFFAMGCNKKADNSKPAHTLADHLYGRDVVHVHADDSDHDHGKRRGRF